MGSVAIALGMWASAVSGRPVPPRGEFGKVVEKRTPHGRYWQYIPKRPRGVLRVVVVAHGMLGEKETAAGLAERFTKRWAPIADNHQLLVLSPAFDQENFGGREGPGGGYRGLFGREIGADQFVHHILDVYNTRLRRAGGKFYLYGHSAGGQFAGRYLVCHPDRLAGVVLSCPGLYPFPNPDVPWANGMARLVRGMRWSGAARSERIDIQPDPKGWLAAAKLPVTVVVGDQDTEPQKPLPGQNGQSRLERARHWVDDMNAWARRHHQTGRVRLVVVPGVGHNSAALTKACVEQLFAKGRRRSTRGAQNARSARAPADRVTALRVPQMKQQSALCGEAFLRTRVEIM